jgi:hypothetical protein
VFARERGLAKHVVVKEEHYFSTRCRNTGISRTRQTTTWLIDSAKGDLRLQTRYEFASSISRSV